MRSNSEDRPENKRIGVRRFKLRTNLQIQPPPVGPVPALKQDEVFEKVQIWIRDQLGSFRHSYALTALRVAYDLKDSSSEPYELPFTKQFGDLSALDELIKFGDRQDDLTEEDFRRITAKGPIPYDFLKAVFEEVHGEFQKAAKEELKAGVYIEIKGSPTTSYAMVCGCNGKPKKFTSVSGASSQAQGCGRKCPQPGAQ